MLRVSGDSMIEDQICDGDFVIVESRPEARDGDTVVALVGGSDVTLKKLYRDGPTVRLEPANAGARSDRGARRGRPGPRRGARPDSALLSGRSGPA